MIRYRPIQRVITDTSRYKPKEEMEVLIVQYDDRNKDIWIPSSLTDFIVQYHSSNELNTKLTNAQIICTFINYLNEQVILAEHPCFEVLKNKGLYGLNHFHLEKYLNYISKKCKRENSYNTVKRKEQVIIRFYDFLYRRGITQKSSKIERKLAPISGESKTGQRGKYVLLSPFEGDPNYKIYYPKQHKYSKPILKDMPYDVWNQFIEFAEEYYPNIALAVTFQIMGGLRMGDLINLTRDSVTKHKNQKHLRLDIHDRQFELFKDRNINLKKCQVKTPRINQPVFDFNGRLFEIWDKHTERLDSNRNIKNRNALFVDNQGYPMTGDSYEKYFYKLKSNFIKYLSEEGYQELSEKLEGHKWGTHIGRHIFTNFLIKIGAVNTSDGKPNPEYLRVLRGDNSADSCSVYIDEKAVIETVIDKLSLISEISSQL